MRYQLTRDPVTSTFRVRQFAYMEVLFTVKPTFNFFSRRFAVRDADGNTVARITRLISPVLPRFRIETANGLSLTVSRKFALAVEYIVRGKSWHVFASSDVKTYRVADADGNDVFIINKELGGLPNRYYIEAASSTDIVTGVCLTVVLDESIRAVR